MDASIQAERPRQAEKPRWHLGHLDALRGIAVMGVLWVHCTDGCRLPYLLAQLALNGQRGVQLFFLVSAFTLFLSSENRRRAEPHPTRNFFIRRIFRLTPMYYAAMVLTAIALPGLFGGWRFGLMGIFFAQGFSPEGILRVAPGAWTLTDEAMFYLCLPLLVLYIRTLRQALLVLLIAAPVMMALSEMLARLHPALYQYFSFLWFPIELPVFLMGIAVYFFWKEWIAPGRLCPSNRARLVSLLFLAGFAVLLAFNLPETNRKLYPSSLGWALLLIAVSVHPWRFLVNRVTIFLGKISFSLYLLHLFVLLPVTKLAGSIPQLAAHPEARFLSQFAATLLISAGGASLTWLYIEESGIRLGRRLIAHLDHRAAQPQATVLPVPAAALLDESNSSDAQF